MKASSPTTSCPAAINASHRCEPMKPAAPVTTHFMRGFLSHGVRGIGAGENTSARLPNYTSRLHDGERPLGEFGRALAQRPADGAEFTDDKSQHPAERIEETAAVVLGADVGCVANADRGTVQRQVEDGGGWAADGPRQPHE